ncbi:MAG: hypothetical protein IJN19_07770, partial [Opitutales bacterium]|nr:hypothetical protein [Opitutales bacterium]
MPGEIKDFVFFDKQKYLTQRTQSFLYLLDACCFALCAKKRGRKRSAAVREFPLGSMKMLTETPNQRVFTLQEIQKHRRCVISVTPCEASNASRAWGVRT